MKSFDDLSATLRGSGIHPSVPRIKILEYLMSCGDHPTAEQIYHDLKPALGSLSKATVYNTLALLVEKGLVREAALESNESRYDILTRDHGHFVCDACGRVFDFAVRFDDLHTEVGGRIRQRDVIFRGVCSGCLHQNHKEDSDG